MLLPPRLPHEHHVPVGPGSGVGAATGSLGGAGNTGDDEWEVAVAAPGLVNTSLTPGSWAGRVGLAVAGLQDTTGRTVVGGFPCARPCPRKAAVGLAPSVAGALFGRVVSSLPKNGCRAVGLVPEVFDSGLPTAIPVAGRPRSPAFPSSGE